MKPKWFSIFFALSVLLVTGKAMGSEANACLNRGDDYFKKGQYDQAIAEYNRAIEIDPTFASAYNNRGVVYGRKEQHDQAIAEYNRAIEIDPKFALAYYNRAISYEKKGQHGQAIADYNKAVEIDPKFALKDRFIVTGDEVYDRKTNRTWKRCNYGQTWDAQNKWCIGVIKRVPIDHAVSEVKRIKGGWKVPDVNELMSLMEVSCGTEKDKAQGIFADVKSSEWYATSTSHGDSHVMAVECIGAQAKAAGVGNQMFSIIRLVREGK